MDAQLETPHETIVCERKPFYRVLFSPFVLIFSILSFGIPMLVIVFMHFVVMPRRVWIRDHRLYADKWVPQEGVDLGDIHLGLGDKFYRFLRVYFPSGGGGETFLLIHEMYFGAEQFDRAMSILNK